MHTYETDEDDQNKSSCFQIKYIVIIIIALVLLVAAGFGTNMLVNRYRSNNAAPGPAEEQPAADLLEPEPAPAVSRRVPLAAHPAIAAHARLVTSSAQGLAPTSSTAAPRFRYPVNPGDPLPDPQNFSIEHASPDRAALLRRSRNLAQTMDSVPSRGFLHRVGDASDEIIDAFYYFIGIYEPIPQGIARPLPGRVVDFDLEGRRIRPSATDA